MLYKMLYLLGVNNKKGDNKWNNMFCFKHGYMLSKYAIRILVSCWEHNKVVWVRRENNIYNSWVILSHQPIIQNIFFFLAYMTTFGTGDYCQLFGFQLNLTPDFRRNISWQELASAACNFYIYIYLNILLMGAYPGLLSFTQMHECRGHTHTYALWANRLTGRGTGEVICS